MSEFENVILPDDYQETSLPQEEVVEETPVDDTEWDTNPTEQTEELAETQQEQPLTFKIKYNKEEQELTYDDAIPLIQKGMNYDKQLERLQQLESDPRLAFVEQLAQQQGMDVEEYLQAVQVYQEEERLNQLVQQNIPEEYAKEILENRKFREEFENERKTKSEQERQNAEYNDFFQYFKNANGRDFDTTTDQIPQEVWDIHANGVPLKYAFMEHHSNQLSNQIKVLKQNQENTKKAPIGSLSAHGSQEVASEDDFLRGFNSI
jgi:hypothetical protein